jgi:hypothetical protein
MSNDSFSSSDQFTMEIKKMEETNFTLVSNRAEISSYDLSKNSFTIAQADSTR